MSHTPGSWTHYDDSENPQHRHMIAASGKTVAHIYCTKGDERQDAANASLIASAPDLLEALKGAAQYIILAIRQGLKEGLSEETLHLAEADLKAVTDAVKKAEPDNADPSTA